MDHIPKPLRATPSFGGAKTGVFDIRFADDSFVGAAYSEEIANLFAASPDLLEACEDLLNANDQITYDVHVRRSLQGTPCDCIICAQKKATVAIAKARGVK
jgi:hypothetical protein